MKINDRIKGHLLNTFAPLEILQSLGDAVSIQDTDFIILYQNQAQKNLNGSHEGEYCYQAYACRDSVCEGCPVAISLRDGKTHKEEMNTSDEKLKVEITASALKDPAGNIVACVEVVRDITERKKTEWELQQFRHRLEDMAEARTLELAAANEQLRQEIAERQWAEQTLRETNSLLSSLIESPKDVIIFSLDRDYQYTAFNKAHAAEMKKVWGVDIKEGMSILDYIPGDEDREKAKNSFDRTFGGEQFVRIDEYGEAGNRYWYEISFNPIFDESQKVKGLTVFIVDITDRRNAEVHMRESEEKTRAIADTSIDAIIMIDGDGTISYMNPAGERMFGYRKEDMLGNKLHDMLVSKEARKKYYEKLPAFRNNGTCDVTGKVLELTAIKKDGTVFPIELAVTSVKIQRQWHSVGMIKDITERKLAENALKASEDRYRRIANAVTDYTYAVRVEDGRAAETSHSAACISVTGYSCEEFAADPYLWIRMVIREDHVLVQHQVEEILSGNFPGPVEHRIVRKDGAVRWVESTLSPSYDIQGKLISYDGIVRDITERKKTESILRDIAEKVSVKTGENYFQSLTQFITEELGTQYALVGELDADSNTVKTVSVYAHGKLADNMAYNLRNTPCEEVIGKQACIYLTNVQDRFPEDTLLADMGADSYAAIPLFASDGRPLGIIATLGSGPMEERDKNRIISLLQIFSARASSELERIKAEENLNEAIQFNKEIIKDAAEGIIVLDRELRYVVWNPFMERISGVPAHRVVGQTATDVFPHLKEQGVDLFHRRALHGESVTSPDTPFYVPQSGRSGWVSGTYSPHRNGNGEIIGIIGLIRDVSERKKAEQTLRFLSLVTEQISDSVITTNLNFEITYANQASQDLFGYSTKELLGKSPNIFNAEPTDEEIQKDIYRSVSSGGIWRGELLNRRKDGSTFHCSVLVFPLHDEEGNIFAYAGIQRDISERRKSEEEQERLNAELESKNRELEQVIYATSHDLRTPLVNIDGFSRELGKSVDDMFSALGRDDVPADIKKKTAPIVEEYIPEALKYISLSISKMDSLLSGLLKLSRLGRAELRMVKLDMNELLSDVMSIFKSRINNTGVRLEVSDLPPCTGDEKQISQVFSNLIDNAMKSFDPNRPGVIRISGSEEKDHSIYCVEDNGIGIAVEYQEKIFDMFKQLEPLRGKGEGLGLTIVRKSVERHNGKIWLESEPGKGSRFFVSLPE